VALADSNGLQPELEKARKDLEAAVDAIDRLRRARVAESDHHVEKAAALRSLEAERATVTKQLDEAQASLRALRSVAQGPVQASVDPELVRLRQELAVLRTRYTELHPDVQAVQRRIAEREAAAPPTPSTPSSADADAGRRLAEAEVTHLSTRRDRLEAEIGRLRGSARAKEAEAKGRLAELERDRSRLEETYLALRRKQAEMRSASTTTNNRPEFLRLVALATPPERPDFPAPSLFPLAGLLLGLAAGVGVAVLAEIRDRSIKNAAELEALLGAPVLAEIPFASPRGSTWRAGTGRPPSSA
jgi:uncharacterized protein involved in exopolysaccharide biosynthesis